jgi:hypothetical protein
MKWTESKESSLLVGSAERSNLLAGSTTKGESAPSRLVLMAGDQRTLLDLAGLESHSEAPPDLPLPTLRAALEEGSVFIDLGAAPGRDRRLLSALACGARAVVAAEDHPFARALAAWGASIQFSSDDPAALRAALLLAEEGEAAVSASRQRELELADAWIEDTDAGEERTFRLCRDHGDPKADETRGPDLLFALDIDPDDHRQCQGLIKSLDSCSLAILGTSREPASTGESELECELVEMGFGFQRRALIGAGRRLDLIVRRAVEAGHE